MMKNINPNTGIAYGYISADALDRDLVTELMDNGTNETMAEAYEEWKNQESEGANVEEEPDERDREFWDAYEDYEPTISGEKDGIKYATSWLAGALNFFIFSSPFITEHARLASPCVPNAGILDTLDGNVQSYDVPSDWRWAND